MNDDAAKTQTLPERTESPGAGLAPLKPHLFLVLEADRPGAGGARYALEGVDEVLIGRGPKRAAERGTFEGRRRLTVRVPGQWMSSAHTRLVLEKDGWVVEDAGSKNGTFLRGDRIDRARSGDGDLIDAGRTFFALRAALPTPGPFARDTDWAELELLSPGLRTLLPDTAERLEALARVMSSNVSVLLFGESGTGKELLARAVHERSKRAGSFVAVNCGALPGALVESLLFGHVRGAFSSAVRDEPGLVRSAAGGTLFLDEIGDLPLPAQASLLRILQEREVLPVGGTRAVPVDLRVVSATHRPLDALAARGAFRADLLARLDGFRHTVPPLRSRREDLGLLIASLLARLGQGARDSASFTPAAVRLLASHGWPSNVRELEQALARAFALSEGNRIDAPALSLGSSMAAASGSAGLGEADARLREQLIAELARHQGNVSEVARSMGKARMQIQRWMQRFGVDAEAYRKAR